MKKITIVGTPNPKSNYQTITVTITEQTAIGNAFGTAGSNIFRASNGIELNSYEKPATSANANRLYVRGSLSSYNNASVEVPAAIYPRLLAAAEEYNKTFKEKVVRHISIKVAPNPKDNFQSVLLTITGQSHRGINLTDEGKEFKASNGIRIQSTFYPSFAGTLLTLRGTNGSRDNDAVVISIADLPKVKEAIKEYNRKYAAPAPVVKELKITGNPVAKTNYQTVRVEITKQSHILDGFGTPAEKSKGAVGEFIHGKIRLASCKEDAMGFKAGVPTGSCAKNGLVGTFYVANTGGLFLGDPRLTCEVPVEVYPLIQQAVLAYDKQFGAKQFVLRLNSTSPDGLPIGTICELIEQTASGSWKVKKANGQHEFWDKGNGVLCGAPAADAEVVKDGVIYIG